MSLGFFGGDFLPVLWITLLLTTPASLFIFVCLFGLPTCVFDLLPVYWIVSGLPLIKAAFGSQPSSLGAVCKNKKGTNEISSAFQLLFFSGRSNKFTGTKM